MSEQDDKDTLNLLGLNKLFDEFVDQYAKLNLEDS
jgi:choline kinase